MMIAARIAVGLVAGAALLGGGSPARGAGLTVATAPAAQSAAEAASKSSGCRTCHTASDAPSMHSSAAVVLGCADAEGAKNLQQTFNTRAFRTYTSDDVAGIELGGALKNIFAIAAGICDGLGLGDNSKAALITRALAELIRLGVALGGRRETFQGLSGIGDLMVTCFSRHSRNRLVGDRIGRGESPAAITASMKMVAEGVPTTRSAWECAHKMGVVTPVIDQMHAILYGNQSPKDALSELMLRDPKPERE